MTRAFRLTTATLAVGLITSVCLGQVAEVGDSDVTAPAVPSEPETNERERAIAQLMELIDIASRSGDDSAVLEFVRDNFPSSEAPPAAPGSYQFRSTLISEDGAHVAPPIHSRADSVRWWCALAPSWMTEQVSSAQFDPDGTPWHDRPRRFGAASTNIAPGSIQILPPSDYNRVLTFVAEDGTSSIPHLYIRRDGRTLDASLRSPRQNPRLHAGVRGHGPHCNAAWLIPAGCEVVAWDRRGRRDPWTGIAVWVETTAEARE